MESALALQGGRGLLASGSQEAALEEAVEQLKAASKAYLPVSHLLWGLWGLIQVHVCDPHAFQFLDKCAGACTLFKVTFTLYLSCGCPKRYVCQGSDYFWEACATSFYFSRVYTNVKYEFEHAASLYVPSHSREAIRRANLCAGSHVKCTGI